jgi:hypothetical protein
MRGLPTLVCAVLLALSLPGCTLLDELFGPSEVDCEGGSSENAFTSTTSSSFGGATTVFVNVGEASPRVDLSFWIDEGGGLTPEEPSVGRSFVDPEPGQWRLGITYEAGTFNLSLTC